MQQPATTSYFPRTDRQFLLYTYLFLLAASLLALGQNYLRYGDSPNYRPGRSVLYLAVSLLVFAPLVPAALGVAKQWLRETGKAFWWRSALLILAGLGIFYLCSGPVLYLLDFWETPFSVRYARSYLGRAALQHLVVLSLVVAYARYGDKKPAREKMITGSRGRKKVTIPASSIRWAEADDHYLRLYGQNFTLLQRTTIGELARELAPEFVRIHRKYLVNRSEILGREKEDRAEFVLLRSGEKLRVGRSYAHLLKEP